MNAVNIGLGEVKDMGNKYLLGKKIFQINKFFSNNSH